MDEVVDWNSSIKTSTSLKEDEEKAEERKSFENSVLSNLDQILLVTVVEELLKGWESGKLKEIK